MRNGAVGSGGTMDIGRRDHDYLFKFILIGDSGVGKTSILSKFADDKFSFNHVSTIGVDFKMKTMTLSGYKLKLQLWDTAGQERFRTIIACYYRGAHGVLVVFDVHSAKSFASVRRWLAEMQTHCDKPNVRAVLVGNKCDHLDGREVDGADALRLANALGIPYIETSARLGDNVQHAFETLAQTVLGDRLGHGVSQPDAASPAAAKKSRRPSSKAAKLNEERIIALSEPVQVSSPTKCGCII